MFNLYSPRCDIYLDEFNTQNISLIHKNGNVISIKIKNKSFNTTELLPVPKTYLINDIPKYECKRICPLVINTIEIKKCTILVEVNEPTFLYFYEEFKINYSFI